MKSNTANSLKQLIKFKKVKQVFDLLKKHGGESRFIGGCVRDSFVNLPIKDVDIATTLLPEKVEQIFSDAGFKTISIGKSFGTVIVIVGAHPYEITTLRKDIETDGRKATKVEFTDSWDEDALRRDFTINAMSYCPYKQQFYDYFDGEEHLKMGIIKFVGDPEQRVQEDYLRILRFFRFYTYFGKSHKIDTTSIEMCQKYANHLEILSGERKHNEFHKILLHKDRTDTIALMLKHDVLAHLFNHKINTAIIFHLKRLDYIEVKYHFKVSVLLRLLLIADLSQITINNVVDIFKLSGADKKYLQALDIIAKHTLGYIKKNIYHLAYKHESILADAFIYLLSLKKSASIKQNKQCFLQIKALLDKGIKKFPVKGGDLISILQIDDFKLLNKMMLLGEKFWCASKFEVDKDAIIDYIKSHCNGNN